MPPRLRVARTAFKSIRWFQVPDTFVCPSCSTWRLSYPLRRQRASLFRTYIRSYASTISSATTINGSAHIPPAHKELYEALDVVKSEAGSYVNLSRLQLALNGLAARDAVIRIAVLSIGDSGIARRLVKALLADPLAEVEAWEKELENGGDGRALLLRYGEEDSAFLNDNPLVKTIHIPSTSLQRHNLEILVTSLNIDPSSTSRSLATDSPRDAFLIPTIQIPTSFSGRQTLVTYPVHKAVVVGRGIESAVAYGSFMAGHHDDQADRDMLKVAIDIPAPETETTEKTSALACSVDIQLADAAISTFRKSVANSIAYEKGWFRSGLAPLQKWLVEGSETPTTSIKPALVKLLKSTLDESKTNVAMEESQYQSKLLSASVPAATKTSISTSITTWAEHSHRELRNELDEAFTSHQWRRISWWKLFFRVDDVTMITSDVLERRWLLSAEKALIFIGGRLKEAGYSLDAAEIRMTTSSALPDLMEARSEKTTSDTNAESIIGREGGAEKAALENTTHNLTSRHKDLPSFIRLTREHLLNDTIPPLQALAQLLVLQTYSTAGLMSALAGLTYVASPAWSPEAGAIAALGVVYSLRRLQRRWEGAREYWEADVREQARKALKASEEMARGRVEELSRPKTDLEGVEARKKVREVIERARKVLEKVVKG
ncbi:hypothetical protein EJ05DRAFT_513674 [Pseudovirgaria hyperparasitica]|uniref:Mmc1 C-terminal domain-containing protein n=1 Tax=Pseudovirgaria hyperparasitica TaxID=470096 RepID=A0A6A6VWZ8_9PEZI|nr:uncharacterized protein EJ05DRAFT_513674 [Pseudovirgaria hyperparasitica]KAF2754743.1 hypothetical protein EJ05DRAFT_513674 [Pseudovirgaria hyperparasitica]